VRLFVFAAYWFTVILYNYNLIHLETHPVVDLIVGKCYMILEGVIPGHAI
jgi:hypothetical protein